MELTVMQVVTKATAGEGVSAATLDPRRLSAKTMKRNPGATPASVARASDARRTDSARLSLPAAAGAAKFESQ